MTIDCTKIQSITREKTAYVVPNAILICTDEEKVSSLQVVFVIGINYVV